MMRISQKQKEEIEFLMKHFGHGKVWTKKHEVQFIEETVHGKKGIRVEGDFHASINPIVDAKRYLEISISLWKQDLINGLLGIKELYEDFDYCRYGKNLVDSVLKSLKFERYKSGEGYAILALSNCMDKSDLLKK